MSLDLQVYCRELSDDLIPKMVKRLNDFEMVVEIYPDFSFVEQIGFLPFKFRLTNPPFDFLKGKELKSGFELYFDDFDLGAEKYKLNPKASLLKRLLGSKQAEVTFASPEIEKRLSSCKKLVTFIWHASDSFELRFAALASAILTELTDGICCYPADNIWYDNKDITNEAFKEVKQYEESLKENEIEFHEFDEW